MSRVKALQDLLSESLWNDHPPSYTGTPSSTDNVYLYLLYCATLRGKFSFAGQSRIALISCCMWLSDSTSFLILAKVTALRPPSCVIAAATLVAKPSSMLLVMPSYSLPMARPVIRFILASFFISL